MNFDIGPGTMENGVDMGPIRVQWGMKQKRIKLGEMGGICGMRGNAYTILVEKLKDRITWKIQAQMGR